MLLVKAPGESYARLELIALYTDGLAIEWSQPNDEHRGTPRTIRPLPRVEVNDNHGTFYFSSGGGGHSASEERSTYRMVFAPAIPAATAELRITINDEGFAVPLPGRPD